jgi:hypothetical protein
MARQAVVHSETRLRLWMAGGWDEWGPSFACQVIIIPSPVGRKGDGETATTWAARLSGLVWADDRQTSCEGIGFAKEA